MIAGVHYNPLCTEPAVNIDIASEIPVDGFSHKGRIFGDVDCRKGMQAEMDIMFLACLPDTRGARIVEAGEGVVGSVELDVDVADIVSGPPCDGLLEPETAPDIDPDPVSQRHFLAPTWLEPVFPKSAPQASLFPPASACPGPRQTAP